MPFPKTLAELTQGLFNEISYNATTTLTTGSFIPVICNLIRKCGVAIQECDAFDDVMCNAIMDVQRILGKTPTGILTAALWSAMVAFAENEMSDTIETEEEDEGYEDVPESTHPHYNSFFDANNYKMHRRNNMDIKIVFGNNAISKTIKNVYMRSVNVEVDTSGNPVSEIYEFIAQDIVESDEMNDADKYTYPEAKSPDVSYQYNFQFDKTNHVDSSGTIHGGGGRRR